MLFSADIEHTGTARAVDVAVIIARSYGTLDYLRTGLKGHPDPDTLPVAQWRWGTVVLPAASVPTVSSYSLEWTVPQLEAGVYDVHRVIVDPPRWNGETYAEAYDRTELGGPRDWDDDVFTVAPYREWGLSQ